jgi:hypothetical protein
MAAFSGLIFENGLPANAGIFARNTLHYKNLTVVLCEDLSN